MTTSRQVSSRLAGLLLVIITLVACSAENGYTDQGDQLPRSDLRETSPSSWNDVEVVDDSHLRVTFWGGIDDCWGHDVEVEESADAVTISLVTGALPRAWEGCDGLAVEYTTLVEIAEPLGDREILDGNAG